MYSDRKVIFAVSFLVLITGCSSLERVVYRPNINQGNYLESNSVSTLKVGMTKEQVLYTLGTPMLTDPFGEDVWYYVFRGQSGHDKAKQRTLILSFDKASKLEKIDDRPENESKGAS